MTRLGRGRGAALALAGFSFLIAGCGWFAEELAPDTAATTASVFYKDLDEVDTNRPINYSVDLGQDPREVYLVFTNPTSGEIDPPALDVLSINGGAPSASQLASMGPLTGADPRALVSDPTPSLRALRGPAEFLDWTPTAPPRSFGGAAALAPSPDNYVPGAPGAGQYSEGSTYEFYDSELDPFDAVLAARNEFPTANGTKTVEVWVATSVYNSGDPADPSDGDDALNPYDVTTGMAQDLADAFLSDDDGTGPCPIDGSYDCANDIYDWISAIFGAEWAAGGDAPYSIEGFPTVDGQDTITILLYPILIFPDDEGPGGVVGFFWSKDNFSTIAGSNRRIMFYLDSDSFAFPCNVGEGCVIGSLPSWQIEDVWPNDIVSTLAHEYQHMINFHVRGAMQGLETDLWMNELMSLVAEDFVEFERTQTGPRGVDPSSFAGAAGDPNNTEGRLPLYNSANSISLSDWGGSGDDLESYSIAYAFGAFLARNYGGASLYEALSESTQPSASDMITDAIFGATAEAGVTMEELLMQWGAAVVLSDDPTQVAPTRLNSGTWIDSQTSSAPSESYSLGSINHFAYSPAPEPQVAGGLRVLSTSPLPPHSKIIYQVGTDLSGVLDLEIIAAQSTDFAVVVK